MPFSHSTEIELSREQVAVAITHGAFGSHIGIIFHSATEGLRVLHLAWHHILRSDPLPNTDRWIATPFKVEPLASKQLVSIVRAIAKRQPHIGYATDAIAAKGSFDSRYRYSPPKGSHGLTCATFVAEIFLVASLPLVNVDTWVPSAAGFEWARNVCQMLSEKGVSAEHVAAVRASNNGIRVRPEEVGAAADQNLYERPFDFSELQPLAKEVFFSLQAMCPLPAPFIVPHVEAPARVQ